MKYCIVTLCFLFACNLVNAAQPEDHWYKVETKEQKKSKKTSPQFPYDSLEKSKDYVAPMDFRMWNLDPKLMLGFGFHADKSFWEQSNDDRWLVSGGLRFRVRPWHRVSTHLQLLQNNSLLLNASWEFMPSRQEERPFYGIGAAHLLNADQEFRNFLEGDRFFLTGNVGYEFLRSNNHAISIEIRAYLGSNSYALQGLTNYVIPF